jgi:hypothetical protein
MPIDRREFSLGLLAQAAALAQTGQRGLKHFSEVSASLYAWDLADEGVEPVLETLHETTGANSAYLVALMHQEKRPLTDFYYPHDPKRKTYFPEDSRVYWQPHAESYRDTRIKPLTSDRPEFKDRDTLDMLVKAARKAGWKTGAEISHTVLDLDRAAGDYSFAVQRDIYGHPLGQMICPNIPDSRAYVIGLFTDLVRNYDLDFVQTCLLPFVAGRLKASAGTRGLVYQMGTGSPGASVNAAERILHVALGGCFCEHCAEAAKSHGFDLGAVRRNLLPVADMLDNARPAQIHEVAVLHASNTGAAAVLLRHPEIFEWLKFRALTLTDFYRDIHAAVARIRPSIDLRLNAFIALDPELNGLDVHAMAPYLGSVRSSDYSEQRGSMAAMEQKRQYLLALRYAIGDEKPLISAIGIRPKATPELIRQGVLISRECGADGLGLGHYDGASLHLLKAIRSGIEDADAVI